MFGRFGPPLPIQVGDRVEVIVSTPLVPGSNISLEPGDHVTVLRRNDAYCVVQVIGGQVAVLPLRAVRFVSSPDRVVTGDPVLEYLQEDLPPEA